MDGTRGRGNDGVVECWNDGTYTTQIPQYSNHPIIPTFQCAPLVIGAQKRPGAGSLPFETHPKTVYHNGFGFKGLPIHKGESPCPKLRRDYPIRLPT